ncbi:MAG: hypothetical protein RLO01_12750 [Thalassobaculaceae bacterium]
MTTRRLARLLAPRGGLFWFIRQHLRWWLGRPSNHLPRRIK